MKWREIALSLTGRVYRFMTKTFEKLSSCRQHEILDAAAGVFARKGYFQAGISEICDAARISNGALYKYFRNKHDLFVSVALKTQDLLLSEAGKIILGDMSIWDRLHHILKEVPGFTKVHRDYFIVYMDLGSPSMDEFAPELSDDFEKGSFDFFVRLIETAKEKGEIRPDISNETATYFIDNHLMLFAFSCVSEHYNRRFNLCFGKAGESLDPDQKVQSMMRSFRQVLGKC